MIPMRLCVLTGLLFVAGAFGQQSAEKCTGLSKLEGKQFPNATTAIETAAANPARAAQGQAPALPEHCEVIGKINERIGFNSQRFAIRFHMRLPAAWNGKFFFEGGGGSNGNLGNALGNLQGSQRGNALTLGYAVVSQDSGHDNTINNDPNLNGNSIFEYDPQARIDHGYNSYDQVTQAAKALIRLYYGRAPEKSYFVGCSEGGREGLLMTQKFPAYFDGVLACAPGIRIPKAAVAQMWNFQTMAGVAKTAGIYDRDGVPFVNKSLSDEDLALVSNAVLEACDALDGAKDGMVGNFVECNSAAVRPKLAAVTCKGGKRATCLTAAQIAGLERIMAGPKNAAGEAIYSDWAWDAGMGGRFGDNFFQGWRSWSIGSYDSPTVNAVVTGLVATNSAAASTPPQAIRSFGPDAARYLLDNSIDTALERARTTTPQYQSILTLLDGSSTDLAAFKARGGKLIIAHGVSDPIFSIKDSIAWMGEVNKAQNGTAAEFMRLFPVPGMNHCAGGPATDQFDAFSALVAWVEKSTAPERIVATAGNQTPWPGRTRPLCAYPKIPKYTGSGSLEDAASFVCQ
jgi:feruloyl esterase